MSDLQTLIQKNAVLTCENRRLQRLLDEAQAEIRNLENDVSDLNYALSMAQDY